MRIPTPWPFQERTPARPSRPQPAGHPLEVKRQVRGNDGDVHEVDDVLVLPPVQVLVDVQVLQGAGGAGHGLWVALAPSPHPSV